MNRTKETNRFKAKSDTGNEYTIVQYQDIIDVSNHDDLNAEISGFSSMLTTNGLIVNYIDSKTFKIVETNEIVHKVE